MSICVLAAGKMLVFAGAAFTLSWTHSVEKTRWVENWQVTPAGLQVIEARVQGSGAGMEPPEGSILKDGWWVYRPSLGPQRTLALAASGATGAGWMLCAEDGCAMIGRGAADPALVTACDGHGQ
ncbi:MAG: DUF1850 domain-containing protein [Proteobacteria bacterium]|jgi:hypothetical protein|nr:MAG: DUF1850 domain-containing protein [Pseudomonadota bacterium]